MQLLQESIANISKLFPGKQAVTDGSTQVSYRELEIQSNRLAHALINNGVTPGGFVLICAKRSTSLITAMLAILKADAAYVPLDVRTPVARRSMIIEDCRPQAIVCDIDLLDSLKADKSIIKCETAVLSPDDADGYSAAELNYQNTADNLACVLYTSGSTGAPKGVMISHKNISSFADWAVDSIGIKYSDRVLGTAPFYFDMSLFDIYGALFAGATLCIATELTLLFPRKLLDFAEQEKVTIWKGISSLLVYLAHTGSLSQERIPSLRKVLFGGEPLPAKFLISWMQCFPEKLYYNAYGPTEATGVSMYYRVEMIPTSTNEKIPLGKPCENTELYLVDKGNKIVKQGEIGEIVLGGPCITQGYLKVEEKRKTAFFANPWSKTDGGIVYRTGDLAIQLPDGNYQFMGRKDSQIKFMGYRLELTDIENALISIAGVKDAGVLLAKSSLTDLDELIGYVALSDRLIDDVMAALKQCLPNYMLPNRLFTIEGIPRNSRGKLDRIQLKKYHYEKGGTHA